MKISILVNEIDIRGGTHKQVLRLAEYLQKKHIDFELITRYCDLDKTYPGFSKFPIKYIKQKKTQIECNVIGIRNILSKIIDIKEQIQIFLMIDKNTVVNIHDQGLHFVILFIKLFTSKKIVWQINDLPGAFLEGNCKELQDNFKYKIWRLYFKHLSKYIDKITVNVSKNKKRIEKHFNRSADVFYCGTDINPNIQRHLRIQDKDNIRLVSTGVFFSYRNYETLINVVELLNQEGTKCTLDIIGSTDLDRDYVEKIKNLIVKKELGAFINILGQVDEKDFEAVYIKSDIFLFVNIDQSWGLAVFEAMGRGMPVIVSESIGAVELLKDNINALIVDPLNVRLIADTICRLKDDVFYTELAQSGAHDVTKFTWDDLYSEKMLNVFKNI